MRIGDQSIVVNDLGTRSNGVLMYFVAGTRLGGIVDAVKV